jgi:hypothetical protein
MERRFLDDLKNHMTGYYLIPKNLRNLTPDATESLSVAFDTGRSPVIVDLTRVLSRRKTENERLQHTDVTGRTVNIKIV